MSSFRNTTDPIGMQELQCNAGYCTGGLNFLDIWEEHKIEYGQPFMVYMPLSR